MGSARRPSSLSGQPARKWRRKRLKRWISRPELVWPRNLRPTRSGCKVPGEFPPLSSKGGAMSEKPLTQVARERPSKRLKRLIPRPEMARRGVDRQDASAPTTSCSISTADLMRSAIIACFGVAAKGRGWRRPSSGTRAFPDPARETSGLGHPASSRGVSHPETTARATDRGRWDSRS
jgi:hypothetical protein